MQDKEFKRFVIICIANTVILFAAVIVLVLTSQGILPEIFRNVTVVVMLISVFVYSRATMKMARKDGVKRKR